MFDFAEQPIVRFSSARLQMTSHFGRSDLTFQQFKCPVALVQFKDQYGYYTRIVESFTK